MKRIKTHRILLAATISIAVGLLLWILMMIQIDQNKEQAYQTSAILLNRMESLIDNITTKEDLLVSSLKEDYTTRAKAVSYIIDLNPTIGDDIEELQKIATLIKVDEIHLFDETGTIYSGTQPQYYGYSFDSGPQMEYFRPMLMDKTFSMCQDVTANTAEGKLMMYAICWNSTGERMLQVGIEPKRLNEEMRLNGIQETIQALPVYKGITMIVGNTTTGKIEGSTRASLVGVNYGETGIDYRTALDADGEMMRGDFCGANAYYVARLCGDYFVAVIQQTNIIHKDVPLILGIVAIYLLIAVTISTIVVKRLMIVANSEKVNATTDYMTGFFNRRGYESAVQRSLSLPDNFVYVSMDLNGLKQVNDTYGHETGDALIQGASSCIKTCFGSYGEVFRIGGDEFAAMLSVSETKLALIKQNFESITNAWKADNIDGISVSCGYARKTEFPDLPLTELAKIAEQRMYQAKRDYYTSSGNDRRARKG